MTFKYGVNFFDSEEFHDAETHLTDALHKFESLPIQVLENFTSVVQDLYNHLGITHCNRGKNEEGMPYLEKASALYKKAVSDEGTATKQSEMLSLSEDDLKIQDELV